MKTIWTIMKKELSRVFKDKKLIFMTMIMPGLLIFLMYSVMGDAIASQVVENKSDTIYIQNSPEGYKEILNLYDITQIEETSESLEIIKQNIYDQTWLIAIVFEEDFESKLDQNLFPDVTYIFNQLNNGVTEMNQLIESSLNSYLIHKNEANMKLFQIAPESQTNEVMISAKAIALLLPFLMITFLFQGAMSVGPESIAGDKERGTIATLLSTPTKRSHIAIGKIMSLSIITLISSISSFIGIIFSIQKMYAGASINAAIYKTSDYMMLFLVTVSTVLLIISLISVLSALAKNVKEASLITLPVYLISMVIGITSMFASTGKHPMYIFMIPIYNSVMMLVDVFLLQATLTNLLVTSAVNLVCFGVLTYLLTLEFNNEKIMFSK